MILITYIINFHIIITYIIILFLILIYSKILYNSICYIKSRLYLKHHFCIWLGTGSLFAMLTSSIIFIPTEYANQLFDAVTGETITNPGQIEFIAKKVLGYISNDEQPIAIVFKLNDIHFVRTNLFGLVIFLEGIQLEMLDHTINGFPIDHIKLNAFIDQIHYILEQDKEAETDPEIIKRVDDTLNPPPYISRRSVYRLVENVLIGFCGIMGILVIVKGAKKAYNYFYPEKPTKETVTDIIPDPEPVIEKPVVSEPVLTLYEQIQNISSYSDFDNFLQRLRGDLVYFFLADAPIFNGILWAILFYLLNSLFRYYIPAWLEERKQKNKLKK